MKKVRFIFLLVLSVVVAGIFLFVGAEKVSAVAQTECQIGYYHPTGSNECLPTCDTLGGYCSSVVASDKESFSDAGNSACLALESKRYCVHNKTNSGPDLTIDSVEVKKNYSGQDLYFKITIKNIGDQEVNLKDVYVGSYLTNAHNGNNKINSQNLGYNTYLGHGESRVYTFSFGDKESYISQYHAGDANLRVAVDTKNVIAETNEGNNDKDQAFSVEEDYVETSNVKMKFRWSNQSSKCTINLNEADDTSRGFGTYMNNIGSNVGSYYIFNKEIEFERTNPFYYRIFCYEFDEEIDDTTNIYYIDDVYFDPAVGGRDVTIDIPNSAWKRQGPDLIIKEVEFSKELNEAMPVFLNIRVTIENKDSSMAKFKDSVLKFSLDGQPVKEMPLNIYGSDDLRGNTVFSGFDLFYQTEEEFEKDFGSKRKGVLTVEIDSNNVIFESNENNNTYTKVLNLDSLADTTNTNLPDLKISKVERKSNDTLRVYYKNVGQAMAKEEYAISVFSGADTSVNLSHKRPVTSKGYLAVNEERYVDFVLGNNVGIYFIKIDHFNQVAESDENNNTFQVERSEIDNNLPDLMIGNVSVSKKLDGKNVFLNLTADIKNVGTETAHLKGVYIKTSLDGVKMNEGGFQTFDYTLEPGDTWPNIGFWYNTEADFEKQFGSKRKGTLTFTVDSRNTLIESNENNNTHTEVLNIDTLNDVANIAIAKFAWESETKKCTLNYGLKSDLDGATVMFYENKDNNRGVNGYYNFSNSLELQANKKYYYKIVCTVAEDNYYETNIKTFTTGALGTIVRPYTKAYEFKHHHNNKPDYSVVDIWHKDGKPSVLSSDFSGDEYMVAKICNKTGIMATTASGDIPVSMYVNGDFYTSSGIAPRDFVGCENVILPEWNLKDLPADDFKVKVVVDEPNHFEETNESNNNHEMTVYRAKPNHFEIGAKDVRMKFDGSAYIDFSTNMESTCGIDFSLSGQEISEGMGINANLVQIATDTNDGKYWFAVDLKGLQTDKDYKYQVNCTLKGTEFNFQSGIKKITRDLTIPVGSVAEDPGKLMVKPEILRAVKEKIRRSEPLDEEDAEVLNQSEVTYREKTAKHVAGRMLLRVAQGGEIWYVNPTDEKKYSVTWDNALPFFQKVALGISNQDLNSIPVDLASINPELDTDGDGYLDREEIANGYDPYDSAPTKVTYREKTAQRLKGRLLLQTEQGGAIWYVGEDGVRRNVRWDNLMDIFRSQALGIDEDNFASIYYGALK